MTTLLAFLSIALIAVIAVQIGKVSELAAKLRGEEEAELRSSRSASRGLLWFMILFLIASVWSAIYYKNYMLGFGPHESASAHGSSLDKIFKVTTFFTGIVFFATQIALFYFSYKYRQRKEGKVMYLPHNTTLEVVWTIIPAVVMTYLVIGGLDAWNEVMADIKPGDENVLEIEATGFQFAWQLRYPGEDNKLGRRDFALATQANADGYDWSDESMTDDFLPSELVLPVGQKVRVRIIARDVLHDFYLPHFRVKMDAVPGLPTYFVFTPEKTTEEYRQELKKYPEYNVPDPNTPEKMLWETFNYELACAELCGTGHWNMRRIVRIVSQAEYDEWKTKQPSYYMSTVYGTDADPWPINGRLPKVVSATRKQEFTDAFETAFNATTAEERTFVLKYVTFETGSAALTQLSKDYELANVVEAMNAHPDLVIELAGHTDNVGDPALNLTLSQERAVAVQNYLLSKGIAASRLRAAGYGETRPLADNATEAGRAQNRRTAFTIVSGGKANITTETAPAPEAATE